MSDIERRSFAVDALQIERRDNNPPRIIGHAAVFDQLSDDLGGWRERIEPGTFAKAISEDDVRALINHEPGLVLGRNKAGTLSLSEDDRGLAVEIQTPDTSASRDLVTSIDRGDINQMSFAFIARAGGSNWEDTDEGTVRTLTDVRLFDVSVVTYSAYPQTDVAVRELRSYRDAHPVYRPVPMSVNRAKLRLAEIS